MKLPHNQKTYVPAEKELQKKWFLVDVRGKILGEAAVKITNLLRGKDKPFFTPQLDCGDYVVAINAQEIKLTKNKLDTKLYRWHTRYPGGLRTRTARELLARKPEKVLYDAVWGMLPRNKLRKHIIKKLKIFPGDKHSNSAQTPQLIEI